MTPTLYDLNRANHAQYLQLCFVYPARGLTCAGATKKLEAATTELASKLPWLASTIDISNDNAVTITPTGEIPLIVKMACRPVYEEMQRAGFPSKWIDENWISPLASHPTNATYSFMLQVNFVPNGLMLVFAAHRALLRPQQLNCVLSALDRICNGLPVDSEMLKSLKPWATAPSKPLPIRRDVQWAYIRLNSIKDAELRLFQLVVSARQSIHHWPPDQPVKLIHEQEQTAIETTVHSLLNESQPAGKFSKTNNTHFNPQTDLFLTSYAHIDAFNFTYHIGTPTTVRQPRIEPQEGHACLMPLRPSSETHLTVAICLNNRDLATLTRDPQFQQHAHYIG